MASITGVRHICTFNIAPLPLIYHFCQTFGRRRTPSTRPFLFMFRIGSPISQVISSVLYRVPRTDSLTLAKTYHSRTDSEEKTTILSGAEPQHSSRQCKESHRCCHGPLAPLANGRFWNIHFTDPIRIHAITSSSK